jgi:hypothetical protein
MIQLTELLAIYNTKHIWFLLCGKNIVILQYVFTSVGPVGRSLGTPVITNSFVLTPTRKMDFFMPYQRAGGGGGGGC